MQSSNIKFYRGIRPDDIHGRMGLRNPERGFRNEIYFSEIPGEIAGTCSSHIKRNKLDGRSLAPHLEHADVKGMPHRIIGNRLDAIEFSHMLWQDEIDYFAYDGVTVMQSYCFLLQYHERKLTQEKLEDIEKFFQKLRQAKVKALLRFAYELLVWPTGATRERIMEHLEQLAPLIQKYKDVIYVLQCGFIGRFGEFHSSFHGLENDFAFHKELFETVLDILPSDRKTMVRYPGLKVRHYGEEPLTENEAFSNTPRSRIGHFNDGFMAGETHGYTFPPEDQDPLGKNRDFWYSYLDAESKFLPMDGELFWRDMGGMALPQDTILHLRRWHYDTLGMVHSHSVFDGPDSIFSIDIWKTVQIDPMFLCKNNLPIAENYFENEYGKFVPRSCYEYIRDHIGYRFELESAQINVDGKTLSAELALHNRGFSAPVNPRPLLLTLENNGTKFEFQFNTDIRKLYGGEKHLLKLSVQLPGNWHSGIWQAGLALPDASEALKHDEQFAIRLANAVEFRNGINRLGEWEL